METFPGRRTADGQWVAWDDADRIQRAVAMAEPVRLTGPDGRLHAVVLARAGRPFTWGGERLAYGYPEPAVPTVPRPARRTR